MGKASRRSNKGAGTKHLARFVCGHCPGMSFQFHDDWESARKDWDRHNRTWHCGRRRWPNPSRLRNIREDGYQEIEGVMPIPAIVRAFL